MTRKKTFKESFAKPVKVNDSRFGVRRLLINTQERPRIKGYATPGRGQNGESSN